LAVRIAAWALEMLLFCFMMFLIDVFVLRLQSYEK